MSAVLLKLFYDGAAQGFAGGVKSRTILLHPINTPQALIHNMAGMRFSENLHPTHSHSWRPQPENQGHAHKIIHILILWPSTSLYQSSSPAPSFTFFLSLSRTHTHILIHKGDWLHSCSVSEDTMAFSPGPLYASGEVFVPMSEEPSLPKMRDGEKPCVRKKDSRKRE